MHNVGKRHDWLFDARNVIHVSHDALVNDFRRGLGNFHANKIFAVVNRLVETWHVNSANAQKFFEKTATPASLTGIFPRYELVNDFAENFLALANYEEIKKIRNRLDVVDARSAAYNKRLVNRTFSRVQSYSG